MCRPLRCGGGGGGEGWRQREGGGRCGRCIAAACSVRSHDADCAGSAVQRVCCCRCWSVAGQKAVALDRRLAWQLGHSFKLLLMAPAPFMGGWFCFQKR